MTKTHEGVQVIRHEAVALEHFPGGASYRTLIGDAAGGARGTGEVRIGIQSSPPGYATPLHSHPYTEILTVLAGEGVAWTEGGAEEIALQPGMTVVLPPDLPHAFRATGEAPLVTYGLHLSGERIVDIHDDSPPDSGHPR
jgi:quercetin dioxygenase-like cupin family protein